MQLQTPAAASSSTPDATSAAPPPASRAACKYRRELFCQHVASGASGAEAVRRAGYSPKGAKQRASYLLGLPEIRLRIDVLRTGRRAVHERHLADAIAVVDRVIADAA
jgi:phage terminase small subunit